MASSKNNSIVSAIVDFYINGNEKAVEDLKEFEDEVPNLIKVLNENFKLQRCYCDKRICGTDHLKSNDKVSYINCAIRHLLKIVGENGYVYDDNKCYCNDECESCQFIAGAVNSSYWSLKKIL